MSNLPKQSSTDSSDRVKKFFNRYFTEEISFAANDVDSVVGFFEKRGFDKISATSTAVILLQQAKLDNVKIFKLLDTLRGLNDVQLSAVVTEVLNYNRDKISTLGYRITPEQNTTEARNIVV
jgi:hypothetical protein